MINGVWRDYSRAGSEIDSDETVVMFKLDRLNEGCPEWICRDTWGRG